MRPDGYSRERARERAREAGRPHAPFHNRGGHRPRYPMGVPAQVCRQCHEVVEPHMLGCPRCGDVLHPTTIYNEPDHQAWARMGVVGDAPEAPEKAAA